MHRSARLHGPSNDRGADRATAHPRECFETETETAANRSRDRQPAATPALRE